jgi:hypothetical protein
VRLYRLIVEGRARYVGTQADARAMKRETGAGWAEIDVPTGKAELLAFLNEHAAGSPERAPVAELPPMKPQSRPIAAPPPFDAAGILARMDNPELGIDAVIEIIARMKGGYGLKRAAGAVAIRFEEIAR